MVGSSVARRTVGAGALWLHTRPPRCYAHENTESSKHAYRRIISYGHIRTRYNFFLFIYFFPKTVRFIPLKGFVAYTHKLPARPPPPPTPLAFDQNQAPTSFKTPPRPSPVILLTGFTYLIKGYISLHSCQIWSPSETGFIVSAHRLPNITRLALIATLL